MIYTILGGRILFIGLFGNISVIIFYGFKCKRKTPYNLFITLLACFDFASCFMSILTYWIQSITKNWKFNAYLCKYASNIGFLSGTVSQLILVGMTIERYRGIVYP